MPATRAKPASRKRAAAKKPSNPLLDPHLAARYDEAIARFQDAKESEVESWDAQYEALDEILNTDPPLYLAGGFKTARAFLAAELPGVDERTARRSCRVARWFDPKDEIEHGPTKLDAYLGYLEAKGGAPLAPAKLHLGRATVEVMEGKRKRRVAFADAKVDVIETATRALRKGESGAKASPAVTAVRAALRKAGLAEVSVSIRSNTLTFGGVPTGRLAAFGRAVAAARV